jgi:hypothetical protein
LDLIDLQDRVVECAVCAKIPLAMNEVPMEKSSRKSAILELKGNGPDQ